MAAVDVSGNEIVMNGSLKHVTNTDVTYEYMGREFTFTLKE